jgi:HEAT repeat protein
MVIVSRSTAQKLLHRMAQGVVLLLLAGMTSASVALGQDLVDRVCELGDPDPDVRSAARDAIEAAGEDGSDALQRGLDECGVLARWEAVKLLGDRRDPALVPVLVKILESDDLTMIRRAAAVALGRTGDERAFEPLRRYLTVDPVAAAEGLGILGDRRAIPDLVELLVEGMERLEEFRAGSARSEDRIAFRAEEGQRAGDLAVIAGAVTRLGSRAGVPTLLETAKFSEWVGMYTRAIFKEYLGDDMPPVLPPIAIEDPNKRVLAVLQAFAKFWDFRFDSYIHPSETEPLPDAVLDRFRAMIRELGEADRDRRAILLQVLSRTGKPIVPLLIEEVNDDPGNEDVLDALYMIGASPRYKRAPRLTEMVWSVFREELPEVTPEARSRLVEMLVDWIHPDMMARDVQQQAQFMPEDVYTGIIARRQQAVDYVQSLLDSSDHRDRMTALKSMVRLGEEQFIDRVVEHIRSSSDPREVAEAIHVLERIRGVTGAPAGKAALQSLELLGDEQPMGVRVQAAESLGFLGDLRGIPVLLQALGAEDHGIAGRAVDALRTIADRYHGYVLGDDEACRKAAERWNRWWEENAETFRVGAQRIRTQEAYYDTTRFQRQDMDDRWWRICFSPTMKERLATEKEFYFNQNEFLPYLIGRFEEASFDGKPLVANLMASRFDRRLMVPFFAETAIHDGDPRVQTVAVDTLGMMEGMGLDAREAEALAAFVAPLLRDESEEPIVRIHAARSLGRLGSSEGIPYLIECLSLESDVIDEAAWHREEAFGALRELTIKGKSRQDFGYEPNAPQIERAEAAAKWAEWWERSKGSFALPVGSARQ